MKNHFYKSSIFYTVEEYHSKWKIIEERYRKVVLTDKFEFHIIQLGKLKEVAKKKEKNELDKWCYFLLEPRKGDRYMNENEEIKKALEILDDISKSPEERRKAELRMKYIWDKQDAEETGYIKGEKEGIKKGRKEGIKEQKIETARRMKKEKISTDIILRVTGLTKEDIDKI